MLPKKYRLSSKEIPQILRGGRRRVYRYFNLIEGQTKEGQNTQIGIIVSKKVCVKPSQRNKIKRRLREALFQIIEKTAPPKRIIISAKKEILDIDFQTLKKEVEDLMT